MYSITDTFERPTSPESFLPFSFLSFQALPVILYVELDWVFGVLGVEVVLFTTTLSFSSSCCFTGAFSTFCTIWVIVSDVIVSISSELTLHELCTCFSFVSISAALPVSLIVALDPGSILNVFTTDLSCFINICDFALSLYWYVTELIFNPSGINDEILISSAKHNPVFSITKVYSTLDPAFIYLSFVDDVYDIDNSGFVKVCNHSLEVYSDTPSPVTLATKKIFSPFSSTLLTFTFNLTNFDPFNLSKLYVTVLELLSYLAHSTLSVEIPSSKNFNV